jgi:hypothetical protein
MMGQGNFSRLRIASSTHQGHILYYVKVKVNLSR